MKFVIIVLTLFPAVVLAQSEFNLVALPYADYGSSEKEMDNPIAVELTYASNGAPIAKYEVHFAVTGGEARLRPSGGYYTIEEDSFEGLVVQTDENGIARVDIELGKMGEVVITAILFDDDGHQFMSTFDIVSLDIRAIVFQIIGGLAVFLIGMQMMSSNLQQVAGNRMKSILRTLTANRFMGVMAGALVTALIQSSSATTVITVSFVNSALMTLQQAVGVILGANIGTTITGQLIAFKITKFAFPMIAIGFAISSFSKNYKRQMWGKVLMGLGLLFLGMTTMSGVMKPLQGSAPVREFFTKFSTSPLLGIFAGTLVTVFVQSSSATVGLTMTLAGSGLIGLQGAFFLVLGDNIGTTITAQLAALGGNRAAKQTAMAHTLIKVIGAIYFAILIMDSHGFFMNLVRKTSSDPIRQVANAHTIFNVVNCLLFIPFVPAVARLSRFIIPSGEEEEHVPDILLDPNLLATPVLAFDNLNREMTKMARVSGKGVCQAAEHFLTGKHQAKKILAMEDSVDDMQRDLTVYASQLFKENLSYEQTLRLPVVLHTINDIERVSDHAVNMVEARNRVEGNVLDSEGPLTVAAGQAFETLKEMVNQVVSALETHDLKAAQKVLILEGRMNQIEEEARDNYGKSLATYGIANMTGLAILDFIDYCERAGDHMKNIAQSILGGGVWHGQEPGE
ncbi:MAG: Na/Pi cotransporter family protein [Candidatus Sabulitectum sp.]|nr:Na/Pi cotransporter family protein [Candidatus Sabulitectum sp.]